MTAFIVHAIPGSPYGRAVLATLIEKNAPYHPVPIAPGQFRTPAHLARLPFGKVPVLEHDGFLLYETQAMKRGAATADGIKVFCFFSSEKKNLRSEERSKDFYLSRHRGGASCGIKLSAIGLVVAAVEAAAE